MVEFFDVSLKEPVTIIENLLLRIDSSYFWFQSLTTKQLAGSIVAKLRSMVMYKSQFSENKSWTQDELNALERVFQKLEHLSKRTNRNFEGLSPFAK
jgi:hypothetical protein